MKQKYKEIARAIPATNSIVQFFHCRHCLAELPKGESPQGYASLEVGFTVLGVQVWCKRHDCNVVHVDFQNMSLPANTMTAETEKRIEAGESHEQILASLPKPKIVCNCNNASVRGLN
jgi:hypothetical protein